MLVGFGSLIGCGGGEALGVVVVVVELVAVVVVEVEMWLLF